MRTSTGLLCLLGLLGLIAVNAIQVSSRLRMQQSRDDQCIVNGTEINVDDEIDTYGLSLPGWNQTNYTLELDWVDGIWNRDDDVYANVRGNVSDRISAAVLNNLNGWGGSDAAATEAEATAATEAEATAATEAEATAEYNGLINNLRSLLYVNKDDIDDDVDIDNDNIDETVLDCTFLTNAAAIPQDRQACANTFRTLEPHFVNFARRAQKEDASEALFWILNTLQSMPDLATNCLNQNFRIPRHRRDYDTCGYEIEETANLLISVGQDNQSLFGAQNRITALINRRIPRIVAYCFGTIF